MYNFINENKNNKCIDIRIKIKLNREPNFRIEALPKINSTATKYHILLRLKAKSLAQQQTLPTKNYSQLMNDNKSYKSLTQKQIIRQLKCLIAKQEQQINKLIKEVQSLKGETNAQLNFKNKNHSQELKNFGISKGLQHGLLQSQHSARYNQHSSRFTSNDPSVINSRNSTNRGLKPASQGFKIEYCMKELQKYIKEFTQKILKPFDTKYLSQSKKSKNSKQMDKMKLEDILREEIYENIETFTQFLPTFLKQTRTMIRGMGEVIEQKEQKERNLCKKVKQQQKTLRQMMKEYQKNIIKSQTIEAKLVAQIKRLKNHQDHQLCLQTLESSQYDHPNNPYQQ